MKGRKAWRQTYKILACMKYEDFISQAYYLANEIIVVGNKNCRGIQLLTATNFMISAA